MGDATYKAMVWNEGSEPVEVPAEGNRLLDSYEFAIRRKLESEFTHGSIEASRDDVKVSLYYRAFDDPQRGRHISVCATPAEVEDEVRRMQEYFAGTKCFTPRELYALRPVSVYRDLYFFLAVHMQNEVSHYDLDINAIEAENRIEIRTIADSCADGRRTWTLETVWFRFIDELVPVMVVNSSGRDGDEYHNRWITDEQMFVAMLGFLREFRKGDALTDMAGLDKVIPEMTEFYGGTIHDYYDVERQEKRTDADIRKA